MNLRYAVSLSLLALVFAVDQGTKAAAVLLPAGGLQVLPSLLSFRAVHNPGLALGLGSGWPEPLKWLIFGVATIGMGVALVHLARRRADLAPWSGALAGGLCGNLADRVRLGAVVDWIWVLPANGWFSPPAFNLADVTLGLAFLGIVLQALLRRGPVDRTAATR